MAYPVYVDTWNKSNEQSTTLKYPVGQKSQTTEILEDVEDIALKDENNNTTIPLKRCRANNSTNNHLEIPLTNEQVSVATIMYMGSYIYDIAIYALSSTVGIIGLSPCSAVKFNTSYATLYS